MKPLLSSSEYPAPWMILICLMKVLLPLSPVPEQDRQGTGLEIKGKVASWAKWDDNAMPCKERQQQKIRKSLHHRTSQSSVNACKTEGHS